MDLEQWDKVTTAYLAKNGFLCGTRRQETEDARRRATPAGDGAAPRVDLYVDPVCPYTWVVTQWLAEVEGLRELDVGFHVMSLRMLNENRVVGDGYRASVEASCGPSRVATAVWVHHGPDALRTWHAAFGAQIFDTWRYPTAEEYDAAGRRALHDTALPVGLAAAARTTAYDDALRRSHEEGVRPVGVDSGTPVVHLDGRGFFGPVLNGVPRGEAALRVFEGARLLAGATDFFELKRARTSPPTFGESTMEER